MEWRWRPTHSISSAASREWGGRRYLRADMAAGGGIGGRGVVGAAPWTYIGALIRGRRNGRVGARPGGRASPRTYLDALTGSERGKPAAMGLVQLRRAALPLLPTRDLQHHLLWWRFGGALDQSVHSSAGPGIGEDEISAVHFSIYFTRFFMKYSKNYSRLPLISISGCLYPLISPLGV